MIRSGGSPFSASGEPSESQRAFTLRCEDIHPCRCDAVFSGPDPSQLVALARRHGELVHCFTPVFYSPEMLAAMTRAAIGAWSSRSSRRFTHSGREVSRSLDRIAR